MYTGPQPSDLNQFQTQLSQNRHIKLGFAQIRIITGKYYHLHPKWPKYGQKTSQLNIYPWKTQNFREKYSSLNLKFLDKPDHDKANLGIDRESKNKMGYFSKNVPFTRKIHKIIRGYSGKTGNSGKSRILGETWN